MNEIVIKNQIVNYEEFMKNNNLIELVEKSIFSTVKQYLRKGAVKPSLKSMVIIMSDIHLGAIRSEPELFEEFFTKMFNDEIPRYDFSELKALIFLGDFFDLCTDSLEDIVNKQKNIFELMHKFMLKKEISIFFTLGNHEIPVNGNYERKFKRRKRKFVKKLNKKLKKHLTINNFFATDCFCQYIILNKAKKDGTLKWRLLLYDKKKQIHQDLDKGKHINEKWLGQAPSTREKDFKCLLTHGFQFESLWRLKAAATSWNFCIKSPDFLKDFIYDPFWNILRYHIQETMKLLPGTSEFFVDIMIKMLEDKSFFDQIKQKSKKEIKKKDVDELLDYLKETAIIRDELKNERYYNEIVHFLSNPKFSSINSLIFGHTHQPQRSQKKGIYLNFIEKTGKFGVKNTFISDITPLKVSIYNSGSWQIGLSDSKPNIVSINSFGHIKIRECNFTKTDKIITRIRSVKQPTLPPSQKILKIDHIFPRFTDEITEHIKQDVEIVMEENLQIIEEIIEKTIARH